MTSQGMPQQEARYGQDTHLEKGHLGYSVPEASHQEAATRGAVGSHRQNMSHQAHGPCPQAPSLLYQTQEQG